MIKMYYICNKLNRNNMKNRTELNEEMICKEYFDTQIGIESLALKYHVGKKKIKEILTKYNISLKKKGGQNLKVNNVISDWRINKFKEVEGKHYIAIDKRNGFTTKDYENKAGVLTTYINKEYNVEIPTLYFRRRYYMETGNYWWEQWFDIKLVDNAETKKCPYCDWETVDIYNKSGMFETHLLKTHGITKLDYLKEFPQEKEYFIAVDPKINRQFETDKNKFVICKVCGKKLGRIDTQHLKIHNMTKIEYIEKYGTDNLVSKEYHDKMVESVNIANINMTFTKNSKSELEIKDFIESGGLECRSDRHILNGREIDIYVPEKNIGIEYNGNKWHTEWFAKKDKNYHLFKMEECREKGVGLITIFEDEYELHKEIVLNKLTHILNIGNERIPKLYGRKCEIKEIYSYIAEDFLNVNHIQGFVNSTLFLGAFYNENLVGVMSFTKQADNNWELTRLATDIKYNCCGVGGKLFNYFIKNYDFNEIKSFADRRWTLDENNNIYTKLGFVFHSFTKPNYTYYNANVNRYKRFHKFNFRKDKLVKKYPQLNPRMTETEMVKELGYDRIWDCGLIKYVYRKNE